MVTSRKYIGVDVCWLPSTRSNIVVAAIAAKFHINSIG